jgi:hypothetical protein
MSLVEVTEFLRQRGQVPGQMLKRGGSINPAAVERDPGAEAPAMARSASDTSIARRAKATAFIEGNAVPRV